MFFNSNKEINRLSKEINSLLSKMSKLSYYAGKLLCQILTCYYVKYLLKSYY